LTYVWVFLAGVIAGPILIFGLLALIGRRGMRSESLGPAVSQARTEAEQELPSGWKIVEADHENFSAGDQSLSVWGAFAEGPGGEVAVGVALTQAEAYRQLARRLRGDLDVSDGWAPPLNGGEQRQQ
jgi:hypothetical protein